MADLTYSASELKNLALEAFEKGDFKTATALAENANETESAQQQTKEGNHEQEKS